MKEIASDPDPSLVAYCGLYCGACKAFRKGRCPGCHENQKAGWCSIHKCCREHGYSSCADCTTFADPRQCKKFNNLMSKIFAVILRSNRAACIGQIRRIGLEAHAKDMTARQRHSLPR